MQTQQLPYILAIADEAKVAAGYHGADMRFVNEYQGRGMYGNCCPGIVGDFREIIRAIVMVDDAETREWLIDNMAQDNMGRDAIVYWPSALPLPEPFGAEYEEG